MQLRRLFEVAKIIDRKLAKDSSMFQLMTSEAMKCPDCLVNKYFDTPLLEGFGYYERSGETTNILTNKDFACF